MSDAQRSEHVHVLCGTPEQRPDGFPCFGCGAQVYEERLVAVRWPDGHVTAECICDTCEPRYTNQRNLDRERDEALLNGTMDDGEGMP